MWTIAKTNSVFSPGRLLCIGHFLGHTFRSIQLMDTVNTDPVYSGVEDEVEFYLYPCYPGDQLQRSIAKAFYYYILIVGTLVMYST